jgi:hypothetical protein
MTKDVHYHPRVDPLSKEDAGRRVAEVVEAPGRHVRFLQQRGEDPRVLQADLAHQFGVSGPTLSGWERGKRRIPAVYWSDAQAFITGQETDASECQNQPDYLDRRAPEDMIQPS